ncbi:MAG: HD domain-containing protein [bacterium]
MKNLREIILRHFEPLLVASIFGGLLVMNFFVVYKASFLNFYYVPTLVAGLVVGMRMSLLVACLSVSSVSLLTILMPQRFALGETRLETWLTLALWGGFLILTSWVVGVLHGRNAEKVRSLRQAYMGTLEILTKYLEASDPSAFGHSTRVSRLAAELATVMGLSPGRIENCRVAGLLHEVGKIDLTEDLGRVLSEESGGEETSPAKRPAVRSARLIDSVGGILHDIVPIIEYHEDPYIQDGRVNVDVPLEAQILAVANGYDEAVRSRPRRRGLPREKALAELEKWSGGNYAPDVVTAFKLIPPAIVERIETEAVGS